MLTAGTRQGSVHGPKSSSSSSSARGASFLQLVPGCKVIRGNLSGLVQTSSSHAGSLAGMEGSLAAHELLHQLPPVHRHSWVSVSVSPEASVPVLSGHLASACHQHWRYAMKHQIMSSCFRKLAAICCRAVYKVFIKVYIFNSIEPLCIW